MVMLDRSALLGEVTGLLGAPAMTPAPSLQELIESVEADASSADALDHDSAMDRLTKKFDELTKNPNRQ
jgi:hypothetical protein